MQSSATEKLMILIDKILKTVAATALIVMMFLTASDVACRYVFNTPILGAMELTEYMMAILVPLSIAHCAFRRSHVNVDMVVERFPEGVRRVCHVIITIISILFLLVLSWQSILNIFETYETRMTSAVLLLPTYPFVIPVAIGMVAFALIMLVQLFIPHSKEVSDGTI